MRSRDKKKGNRSSRWIWGLLFVISRTVHILSSWNSNLDCRKITIKVLPIDGLRFYCIIFNQLRDLIQVAGLIWNLIRLSLMKIYVTFRLFLMLLWFSCDLQRVEHRLLVRQLVFHEQDYPSTIWFFYCLLNRSTRNMFAKYVKITPILKRKTYCIART